MGTILKIGSIKDKTNRKKYSNYGPDSTKNIVYLIWTIPCIYISFDALNQPHICFMISGGGMQIQNVNEKKSK